MHQPSHNPNNDKENTIGANPLDTATMRDPFSSLIKREISFRRITSSEDSAQEGFIKVYQEAFAAAPYFETIDSDFIREKVWKAHEGQLVVVAEEKGAVIGLICGHLVSKGEISPSACGFLKQKVGPLINERATLYFSELAVAPSHQGHGIGSVLVASTLTWANENLLSRFVLRTAAEGSNSLGIFKKFGAQPLDLTQQVTSVEAGGPPSASHQRVFLAGEVSWHGDYLARLGTLVSETIMEPKSSWCHS
jgi:GNAT superfamily N-acetyltransferase